MSSAQLVLDMPRERPHVPTLVRDARRLLRPVLRAMKRGKIATNGFSMARVSQRDNKHALVVCIGRLLRDVDGFKSYVGRSAEKDGVYVVRGMAVKIGLRAELEAQAYAIHRDKHDILAESHVVAPCITVMEEATPLRDTDEEVSAAFYEVDENWKHTCPSYKRINKFTCDAHDGNVAVTSDGRYVLIDYSFDVDCDER